MTYFASNLPIWKDLGEEAKLENVAQNKHLTKGTE